MNVDEVMISPETLSRIREIYKQEPTLRMTTGVLKHHLLSGGFTLTSDGKKRKRKRPPVPDAVETAQWTVFLERALDEILCWGFVAFHDDLSEVDIHRCRIYMHRQTRKIRIVPIKGTFSGGVINAFGFSPTAEGHIVSLVHSLLPWILFIRRVRDVALDIEEHKLKPELVYEKIPEPKKEDADIGMEYYANADDMGRKSEQIYHTTRQERSEYRQEQLRNQSIIARFAGAPQPQSSAESYIPEGHKLAHVLAPTARADTVGLMRMIQQLICGVIGVPRTMIINDSVARADTEATHARFRNTLKVMRRHLNHVLTVAYNATRRTKLYTVGQLNDVYYGPPETLTQMWILGIIDESTYRQLFAREYGVAHAQNPPLFTEDERRELARESIRNLVTQHHGRT